MEYKQPKHTSNRKTDKQREEGGGLLLTTGVGAFLLKQFRRIYFWPQKRNAEQSGLTTIKVMLTNNPRRDWMGLPAVEEGQESGKERRREVP